MGIIRFKGDRSGLSIALDSEAPLEDLLAQIEAELGQTGRFFNGSQIVLELGSRQLKLSELSAIHKALLRHGVELAAVKGRDPYLDPHGLAGNSKDQPVIRGLESSARNNERQIGKSDGQDCLVVRGTLRSGQVVEHGGSILIVGDLNPGAEVIAGCDIVVWGALRGSVRAGAGGDTDSAVYALEMLPKRLTIGHLTWQPAAEELAARREYGPEVASVASDKIVIESWELIRSRRAEVRARGRGKGG